MDVFERGRQVRTDEVADAEKQKGPEKGAAIGVPRKLAERKPRRARADRGEMPHAWNEVPERERPLADALEPMLERVHSLLQMALQIMIAGVAPDQVAEADAQHIPRTRADQRGNQAQLALPHERAGDRQQRFIGNRKADDAKSEQAKERDRPVVRYPGKELLLHESLSYQGVAPRLRPADDACVLVTGNLAN